MKNNIKEYFYRFFDYLQGKPVLGGLEISDVAVRFSYFNGKIWKLESIKLLGGIMRGGQISDRGKFFEVLKRLKNQIPLSEKSKKKISVVVSLNFSGVYSQVFNLPLVSEKNLEEAAILNLQMASPLKPEEAYMGWQMIGRDESAMKVDILGAFISRKQVDDITSVLKEAGFLPIAAEPRALSLVRLIKQQAVGFDIKKPYIVFSLDNESLSFLIIKNGELYFEYNNSWTELRGDKKEISLSDFKSLVTIKLRQVLNFHTQHSPEKISEILVISLGLKQEIKNIIRENFSLPATELQLRFDKPLESEWFASLGSAIRAEMPRRLDQDLSLLGASMKEEFRRQQIASFIGFWRFFLSFAFGVIVIIFIGSYFFLLKMERDLKNSLGAVGSSELAQVDFFRGEANRFNSLVTTIKSIRQRNQSKAEALNKVNSILELTGLTLTQFNFTGFNTALTLTGRGNSAEDIQDLETKLKADNQFKDVKLSPTNVRQDNQGFSFSITFSMIPLNKE